MFLLNRIMLTQQRISQLFHQVCWLWIIWCTLQSTIKRNTRRLVWLLILVDTLEGRIMQKRFFMHAQTHTHRYTSRDPFILIPFIQVVLENTTRADDHDLPVAEASIEMTKVLCDVLKVGEPRKFVLYLSYKVILQVLCVIQCVSFFNIQLIFISGFHLVKTIYY